MRRSSQAQLGLQRLSAQQVDDARLDAQRQAILGPLGTVVVQMSAIDAAAHAGNVADSSSRTWRRCGRAIAAAPQAGGSGRLASRSSERSRGPRPAAPGRGRVRR